MSGQTGEGSTGRDPTWRNPARGQQGTGATMILCDRPPLDPSVEQRLPCQRPLASSRGHVSCECMESKGAWGGYILRRLQSATGRECHVSITSGHAGCCAPSCAPGRSREWEGDQSGTDDSWAMRTLESALAPDSRYLLSTALAALLLLATEAEACKLQAVAAPGQAGVVGCSVNVLWA
ncbi:hypothetical protein CC86DRAFT_417832 [Ophiobolus disseminans]|uniref:Uncharacterized protein n=1 Tax=Ophiobolus disseminans TaxID=1469910 RepID=A0A6A7A0C9_9PLEO|nr:hypothetical protein CC86DRAFT_417832 [Ophiobolus disseminans]